MGDNKGNSKIKHIEQNARLNIKRTNVTKQR